MGCPINLSLVVGSRSACYVKVSTFFFPSAVLGHFPLMHLPWCYKVAVIISGSSLVSHGRGKQQITDSLDKTDEEGLP